MRLFKIYLILWVFPFSALSSEEFPYYQAMHATPKGPLHCFAEEVTDLNQPALVTFLSKQKEETCRGLSDSFHFLPSVPRDALDMLMLVMNFNGGLSRDGTKPSVYFVQGRITETFTPLNMLEKGYSVSSEEGPFTQNMEICMLMLVDPLCPLSMNYGIMRPAETAFRGRSIPAISTILHEFAMGLASQLVGDLYQGMVTFPLHNMTTTLCRAFPLNVFVGRHDWKGQTIVSRKDATKVISKPHERVLTALSFDEETFEKTFPRAMAFDIANAPGRLLAPRYGGFQIFDRTGDSILSCHSQHSEFFYEVGQLLELNPVLVRYPLTSPRPLEWMCSPEARAGK